jgi:hypothetical protein
MKNVFVLAQDIAPTHFAYWFNQGFAVLVVIALGWAVYGWIRWAGKELAVPLKNAGVEYLKESTTTMKSLQVSLAEQNNVVKDIHSTVGVLKITVEEISSDIDILKKRQA